jgi:hypothetical protein
MRKNILLLIMLMGFVGIIKSQTESQNFQVHFNSDEYVLDQTDKRLLLDLAKKMQGNVYCELVLKAHTDEDASSDYNQELSKKRALSVSNYLQENGVSSQRISHYFFGETKPIKSNSTAVGKALNRRVDIALTYFEYGNVNEFLKLIGGDTKQRFKIKANVENTIVAKNGLKVVLPKGALETVDGKSIGTGDLTMELEEFFAPMDAATQQLSTVADGKLLESGGMFSVRVLQKGKELKLKEGSAIQVDLPSKNLQNNMQIFEPIVTDQGVTEWKATQQPFEVKPKKVIKLPFTKINTQALVSHKVNADVHEIKNLEYLYKPLTVPKRPMPPLKRKELTMTNKFELFEWYERMFYSKSYMEKVVKEENSKRERFNRNAQAKYDTKLTNYKVALDKYKNDSANFETIELASFREWLNQNEIKFLEAKTILEKICFNKGIDKFCELSEQEKLTSLNPKAVFISMSKPSRNYQMYYGNIILTLSKIEELKAMSLLMATGLYGNKQSQIFIGLKERDRIKIITRFAVNEYAVDQIKKDPNLAQIFDAAQIDIMQQREKLDLLDPNTAAEKIYSASLSGFGVVNCDRFNTTPENQMAQIEIPYKGTAKVSFFVPDINSFVYAYYDGNNKYNLKLPIGKQVRMIVLGFNEKKEPVFQMKTLTITGNETIVPDVKLSTIYEIRNSLSKI